MDPITMSAIIGAGSSLVNNLLGGKSQQSANEFNANQAQLNREWQEKMWNKQNEYNTPANQVARLQEAGLNPALALGQVAGGSASSNLPGGAQASGNPYNYNFQGVADAGQYYINNIMAMEKNKAEVDQLQLNNEYNRASFAIRLAQAKDNARSSAARADIDEIQRDWEHSNQMSNFQLNFSRQQTEYAHAENLMAQTMLLKKELEFLPEKYRLEFAHIATQIALAASSKKLNEQQIKNMVAKETHDKQYNRIIYDNKDYIYNLIKYTSETANPYYGAFRQMLPSFNIGFNASPRYDYPTSPRKVGQRTTTPKGSSYTEYYYE